MIDKVDQRVAVALCVGMFFFGVLCGMAIQR